MTVTNSFYVDLSMRIISLCVLYALETITSSSFSSRRILYGITFFSSALSLIKDSAVAFNEHANTNSSRSGCSGIVDEKVCWKRVVH